MTGEESEQLGKEEEAVAVGQGWNRCCAEKSGRGVEEWLTDASQLCHRRE